MAIDEGISRISSQSVSDRRWLKIGRCPAIGKICCPAPNNSYIATLVERHTRYVMLAKVAGKDTQTVVSALIKQAKKLTKELYKSLTWDRGKNLRIIAALRGDQHRRLFLRSTKARGSAAPMRTPMVCSAVLSKRAPTCRALASLSEQSGSSAQRTAT